MQYYAVKYKKKKQIFSMKGRYEDFLKKYPNAQHKIFENIDDAQIWINSKSSQSVAIRKCVICNRSLGKKKGWYCASCITKSKKINDFLQNKYNLKYPISKTSVAKLAQIYNNENDIFDYLYKNPESIFTLFKSSEEDKKELRENYKEQKNVNKTLNENYIPKYIKTFFQDNEKLIFISASGTDKQPNIKCRCAKCNKEFTAPFEKLKTSNMHSCDYNLSTGEFLVKKYLEENKINFATQFNTLKCINPKTKHILPYDFEIKERKIIIEVQGQQHEKYIEFFHSSEEAFEYQKYKDEFKKEFALKNGYEFVEIFYKDLDNKNYKKILDEKIKFI